MSTEERERRAKASVNNGQVNAWTKRTNLLIYTLCVCISSVFKFFFPNKEVAVVTKPTKLEVVVLPAKEEMPTTSSKLKEVEGKTALGVRVATNFESPQPEQQP